MCWALTGRMFCSRHSGSLVKCWDRNNILTYLYCENFSILFTRFFESSKAWSRISVWMSTLCMRMKSSCCCISKHDCTTTAAWWRQFASREPRAGLPQGEPRYNAQRDTTGWLTPPLQPGALCPNQNTITWNHINQAK